MANSGESLEKIWGEATTFQELCDLTKKYINGEIQVIPGYYGAEVDPETKEIVHFLTALNANGFMTRVSQPGIMGNGYKQRAFVEGYALSEIALRIAKVTLYSELIVAVFVPGQNTDCLTPVTVQDFRPFTWAGGSNFEELEEFRNLCSDKAMTALSSARYISVIDPVWGRKNYLWDTLSAELCYAAKPHPDLGLDSDM